MDFFSRLVIQHQNRTEEALQAAKQDIESGYYCPHCNDELDDFEDVCCLPEPEKEGDKWKCVACDELHVEKKKAQLCCEDDRVTEYVCPDCGELHLSEDEAIGCCETLLCPVCLRAASSTSEQVDCCLVLDPSMDAMSRRAMVKLLDAGVEWEAAREQAQQTRIPLAPAASPAD